MLNSCSLMNVRSRNLHSEPLKRLGPQVTGSLLVWEIACLVCLNLFQDIQLTIMWYLLSIWFICMP